MQNESSGVTRCCLRLPMCTRKSRNVTPYESVTNSIPLALCSAIFRGHGLHSVGRLETCVFPFWQETRRRRCIVHGIRYVAAVLNASFHEGNRYDTSGQLTDCRLRVGYGENLAESRQCVSMFVAFPLPRLLIFVPRRQRGWKIEDCRAVSPRSLVKTRVNFERKDRSRLRSSIDLST